ncbi:MAG: hypothetical protein IJZ35_04965 [Clostridia bacterium]|nr:hypothetical protein [Clostridia bacterium]
MFVSIDRSRISGSFKANITVTEENGFDAFEVRATKVNEPYMRGVGYDLLSDDVADGYFCENGVAYADSALTSFSCDVESSELDADGEYRISVYIRNTDGIWNDVCALYTNSSQMLVDSNGEYVYAQRLGTGFDDSYTSVFSGEEIDSFIKEVLKNE